MKKLLLILLLAAPAFAAITLTDNATNYQVDVSYACGVTTCGYRAQLVKQGQTGAGMVNHLWVLQVDGVTLSGDLIYQGTYALGWLEGDHNASVNAADGLGNQAAATTVTILQQTSSMIVVEARLANTYNKFSQVWTFWDGRPYFRAQSTATRIDGGALTNEYQFCNMVNTLAGIGTVQEYALNADGTVIQGVGVRLIQPVSFVPNTYAWVNYQYTTQTVSLGYVYTDVNDGSTIANELGDSYYETQINWHLYGGARLVNPVGTGQRRYLETYYYTSNSATNVDLSAFAASMWAASAFSTVSQQKYQATFLMNNPSGQNAGYGSALVNAPYFLVRQNGQNTSSPTYPQYQTSLYGPLWNLNPRLHLRPSSYFENYDRQGTIQFMGSTSGSYPDYKEQAVVSLNYDNDTTTYTYGTVTPSNATNGATTSIVHSAASSDGNVNYASTLATWSDSDKLQITGAASNGASCAPNCAVKDIWLDVQLSPNYYRYVWFPADMSSSNIIPDTMATTDGKWTRYGGWNYQLSGATINRYYSAAWKTNQESVPTLAMPLASNGQSLPNGTYPAWVGLRQSNLGDLYYRWSLDGVNFNTITAPQAGVAQAYDVYIGMVTFSDYPNNVFYVADGGALGINEWAGWGYLRIGPTAVSLGSGVYDIQFVDPIYGPNGIAVKVNSPTDNVVLSGTDLRVYLYKQASQQTLDTFSYAYDVELWPHSGFLTSAAQYTTLHSQVPVAFKRRLIGGTPALAF